MRITLLELLEKIPPDTKLRVQRTKERFNQSIREALRKETGLMLARHDKERDKKEVVSIPISLEPGLPVGLQSRQFEEWQSLLAILALWRSDLEHLRDSSHNIEIGLIPELRRHPQGRALLKGRESHLRPTHDLAQALLKMLGDFDLVRWILEVDRDVLGVYRYFRPGELFPSGAESRIELYWGVIGLVALALPARTEDLALVVLAHELAHAYSHRGFDIDGQDWNTEAFASSERSVKEGLAQYYTSFVCHLTQRFGDGPLAAYKAMLARQSATYRSHLAWIENHTPEEVRSALLETRRQGPVPLTDFNRVLKNERQRLRRKKA